jgi:undecaprenyl-diphosphatase
MTRPDIGLFMMMSGGVSPTRWILAVATALAEWGPWLAAVVLAWAAWKRPDQRRYLMALLAVASATSMLSHVIAAAIALPRPFMLGLSPAHIGHGGSAGLPSTHASVMGFVALALLARPALRPWALPAAIAALLTAWARIYAGLHFPLDILAGFALSAVALGVFILLHWLTFGRLVPAFRRLQQGEATTQGRSL